MKVLVTGASGFLGKYIISELEFLQFDISTVGRNESSTYVADLSSEIISLNEKYHLVIHCAGKAHMVPKTEAEKKAFFDINLTGTKNLIKSLKHKPDYFVYISSVAVYGLDYGININEEAALNATDPYGKSKIMAEKEILVWASKHNIILTILRLPLLLGFNPPGNLKAMIKAIRKKYYFNIGNGAANKSMVLAKDVAKFIPEIIKEGGIFNLTDGHHPSFKELSHNIALFYESRLPITLPSFVVLIMAQFGELIQNLFKTNMPLNKRQYLKMTKSLTFNDKKASNLGWKPKKVINNPEEWLTIKE
ncbi:NAD-dependent epimerase/dehydratase family protein [Litoribaculum gwangyangense]|uniref:NAD-dependent epimerase/dehydratase family protein n=1 Tax=Litoribaculum gwangyangense TaxID=1130722 RepID=A0ABP9C1M1_9FLAO